jgi:hypothetical protein
MKRFVQFFSFAAMTQVILLLNQVVLLPMQIRLWGTSETALWYAAIALAAVTTMADLGLRTAGHVELLRLVHARDAHAEAEFCQIWAWIRLLVIVVTSSLLLGDFAYGWSNGLGKWQLGRALLTVAYAVETVLIIRIVYLDSLGEYSRAESSYFTFAALRLALAVPALLVFKVHPIGLCWLFFATSIVGLVLQGSLCKIPPELRIFARAPHRLSFRTCGFARYTMAEPCANWIRIGLPVLVIAAIAPATAVTTFVALRAIYGAARTTIQQVARVASVEFLRYRAAGQGDTAGSLLSAFMLLAAFIGTALASLVVVDNLRVLSLWLKHFDHHVFQNINLSFALSSPFYSYQVIVALSFRIGRLALMARQQYSYVLYSAAFAGAALMVRSLAIYLALLVVAEIALSTSFMVRQSLGGENGYQAKSRCRSLGASTVGTLLVLGLWMIVRYGGADFLLWLSVVSALKTICLLGAALTLFVVVEGAVNFGVLNNLRTTLRQPATIVSA